MDAAIIAKLYQKRQEIADLRTERAALLLAVTETPKFKAIEERIKTMAAQIEDTEKDVRKTALDEYRVDQNKKPGNGIEIKVFKVATILDPERAREWALNNFTPALKLDTEMIGKAAIDGTIPVSIATVTDEPRAQIAKDLAEFVEKIA